MHHCRVLGESKKTFLTKYAIHQSPKFVRGAMEKNC